MTANPTIATARITPKVQTLEDAYSPPANFLEIDVNDPQTQGVTNKRFTDYAVRMKTNLPVFKLKESSVRRRYSDFEWLRGELERDSKIVVPALPGKAFKRQLPFRGDDGIFEEEFIEERRKGLEQFVNKWCWLDEKDSNGDFLDLDLSDYLRKISEPEWLATHWHKTRNVYTCFYRNPSSIKTMRLEKSEQREKRQTRT